MSISEFIKDAANNGVYISVEGNKLKCRSQKNAMTPSIREKISKNRNDIIAYFSLLQSGEKSKIRKRPENSEAKASYAQQRLWFIEQLEIGTTQYNMPNVLKIEGEFNPDAAEVSINRIIQRHEILRTTYEEKNGELIQIISESFDFKLKLHDFSDFDENLKKKRCNELILENYERTFDLSSDLMIRASYIKLSKGNQGSGILLFNQHHIASDGWSMELLVSEFIEQYQSIIKSAPDPLPPLPIQYSDYAHWQMQWLQGEILEKQLTYWKKQLDEVPAVHGLVLDNIRPETKQFIGEIVVGELPAIVSQNLQKIAKENQVTSFMLVHAALALLLSKHSNTHDIVLGSPIANRNQVELEPLIGFFVNTLVLRVNTNHKTFLDYLKHVRQINLDAQANQDIPFEHLVEQCRLPRTAQHTPLFQIMFTMNTNQSTELKLPGLNFSRIDTGEVTANFDLDISASISEEGVHLTWIYDKSLFTRSHIETLNAHFERLLVIISETPDLKLSDLQILSEQEIQHIRCDFNKTQIDFPKDVSIHALFKSQVLQTPNNIALEYKEEQISYQQLDERSSQWACYLQEQGLEPGMRVGIYLQNPVYLSIAIWSVLKAGGCFVLLDRAYPDARLEYMLEDSGAKFLITDSTQNTFSERLALQYLYMNKVDVSRFDDKYLELKTTLEDKAACLFYTSGSTGEPKGSVYSHQNLVNYSLSMVQDLSFQADDRILQMASFSFDVILEEVLLAWISGATVIFNDDSGLLGMDELQQLLNDKKITSFEISFAQWREWLHWLKNSGRTPSDSLRIIMVGCESIPPSLMQQWSTYDIPLIHVFGLTETTITSSIWDSRNWDGDLTRIIPIGRPIANTCFYILDQHQNLQPIGVPGELYIAGAGVTSGYLNKPELTQARFVQNPFSNDPQDILYRTGDLARWLPDGNVEFIGRGDDQVKIRGFRIELGEIQAQLSLCNDVVSCHVLAREDEPGQKRVVAYVVPNLNKSSNEPLDEAEFVSELRDKLQNNLPTYMVPSIFMVIDKLPLTPNGKVDKKALPIPDSTLLQREYIAPETKSEKTLAEIWGKLLKLDAKSISATANFFDLGGHSLLAVRLVAEIRDHFEQELSIKDIFESLTLRTLVEKIDKGSNTPLRSTVEPINRNNGSIVSSFAQQRLWFIDQFQQGSAEYNLPMAFKIEGDFSVDAAEQAITRIIYRHESLRTTFEANNGSALQVIKPDFKFLLARYDLTDLNAKSQKAKVDTLVEEDRLKPFDLSDDLMVRASYLYLSKGNDTQDSIGILLFNMHHIATDAWSIGVLLKEFVLQYQSVLNTEPDPLPPLPIQYADFAYWQRQWLVNEVLEGQLNYWKRQLQDVPTVHTLPLDYSRPRIKTHEGSVLVKRLDTCLSERLQQVATDHKLTLFMLLHAGLSLVLSRHSNSNDVVVGSPVANRMQTELESLIGFFVNTLVLRVNTNHETLADYLAHVKTVNLDAQAHQDIPFEQLVEHCNVPRSAQHTPLFQILFTIDTDEKTDLTIPGLSFVPLERSGIVAKFDLNVVAQISETGISLNWNYDTSLFTQEHIKTLSEHLNCLLTGIADGSNSNLRDLPMLRDKEIDYLINDLNKTQVECSQDKLIHELFESQAKKIPTHIALVFEGQQLSYQELNQKANRLAHYLREQGVGPETLVGLCIERSLEMVIGILGILKSGGAYVPMDPSYPKARLEYILEDTNINILLTQQNLNKTLGGWGEKIKVLELDSLSTQEKLKAYAESNPEHFTNQSSSNLAYVIYTSGSTGQPKGVMVEHRSVFNRIDWMQNTYTLKTSDRLLQKTPYSFDVSVWEFIWTLGYGARLVLAKPEGHKDPKYLNQIIEEELISIMHFVPSMLAAYLATPSTRFPNNVRYVFCSGEALQLTEVNTMRERAAHIALHNLYGPTEASIEVSQFDCKDINGKQAVPIGKPIQNIKLHVLDKDLNCCPMGTIGELFIGGVCLARGYLNKPDLTREKFIPNPFSSNKHERLYKTGDLVRYQPDGNLEFIGRIDDQVKIRGLRIELGEIESQLSDLSIIKDAAVSVKAITGENYLVAYIVPMPAETDSDRLIEKCRLQLESKLPDYMVPSTFMLLPELPLTESGKINRKALPDPDYQSHEAYAEAQTDLQVTLTDIWQEILPVDKIGINDNFFNIGGHSLLATKMIGSIRDKLNIELPLRTLFEQPTIAKLSEAITAEDCANNGEAVIPTIQRVDRTSELVLSHAQQRLWFIDQLEGGSAHYNMPVAFNLEGKLNIPAFKYALQRIIERHEVLRTNIVESKGQARQRINEKIDLPLLEKDLSGLSEIEQRSVVERLVIEDANSIFDLSRDPMLKAQILHLSNKLNVVLFNMHHIASDGWSMGLLTHEFSTLYKSYLQGHKDPLPPLKTQYADYARWQRDWLSGGLLEQQLNYWREQLSGIPAVHNLPLIKPRPAEQDFNGKRYLQLLNKTLTKKIQLFCQNHDVTMYMLLQTSFALLLSRFSNETDIIIGSPIAGRVHKEVEKLIGFFLNTLILRSDFSENVSFIKQLDKNKQMILDAYTHQHIPFELLVEELTPERNLRYNPVVQILLNVFDSVTDDGLTLPGLNITSLDSKEVKTISLPKADMIVYVRPQGDSLSICWDYRTSIFNEKLINQLSTSFEYILEQVLDRPHAENQDINILRPSEQKALQKNYYKINLQTENKLLVHDLFRQSALSNSDETALVHKFKTITFGELNDQSDRLAYQLIKNGVGKGEVVGIHCNRGIPMVLGVLATLKTGAAFSPLMLELPEERLAYMIQDADIKVVLTEKGFVNRLPASSNNILLDEKITSDESVKEICLPEVSPLDASHVIYTSGSTGKPKGVVGTHASLSNRVKWMQRKFPYNLEEEVASFITASGFIRAVWEMLTPLSAGVKVVIFDSDDVKNPHRFVSSIARYGITRIVTAPSLANALVNLPEDQKDGLETLRYWFISGEPLKGILANKLTSAFPNTKFLNLYGSTEVMSDVSYFPIDANQHYERVPIGKPIDNTQVLILDSLQRLQPLGVPGEICVIGDSLAQGYINHPELNREKFISYKFNSSMNQNLFRTGDMGKLLPDGNIECFGRKDKQVKVRGFRIELEEIEIQLSKLTNVKQAVVLVKNIKQPDETENELDNSGQLVAFVALEQYDGIDDIKCIENFKKHLTKSLPEYMIPSRFHLLESLPLLHNGKIDRITLSNMQDDNSGRSSYTAPSNVIEQRLSYIWQEVLDLEKIGVNDNFFALGGHSLLGIRLISLIRQEFEIELTPRILFEYPTISDIAKVMFDKSDDHVIPPIIPIEYDADENLRIQLSFSQQRLWFLDKLENGSSHYNIVRAIRLNGEFCQKAFSKTINTIIKRHTILRTSFIEHEGEVYQEINYDFKTPVEIIDLRGHPDQEFEIKRLANIQSQNIFNLARDLLLHVQLLLISSTEHVILFNTHHIACDGWSLGILIDEFSTLYREYSKGQSNPLDSLSVQYADYAHWQRSWLQGDALREQLSYWTNKLSDLPPVHKLPLDKPRPPQKNFSGAHLSQDLSKKLTQKVHEFCRKQNVTLFMFMHSALSLLLGRYSNDTDIVIGTPIAGRPHKDLEPLIGLFVNTLVLRTDLSADHSFTSLLNSNKQTILDAYQHQYIPFEMLVEELKPSRSINYNPLFQIFFALHNNEQKTLRLDGLDLSSVEFENESVKFDLAINMNDENDQISIFWSYDDDLFCYESIDRMMKNFSFLIESICDMPEKNIMHIPLLCKTETKTLLSDWNNTSAHYPEYFHIHELFEKQVKISPHDVAVIFEDKKLTYEELNQKSNQLAAYLRNNGVKPEVLVGVYIDRSLEMIIAILGISKAGGAYVPIDTQYPKGRIEHILKDTNIKHILTKTSAKELYDFPKSILTIKLDDPEFIKSISKYSKSNSPEYSTKNPNQLSYVIYTSGSTGIPKGVMIEHSAIINFIYSMKGKIPNIFSKSSNLLAVTTLTFDIAGLEIWGPLLYGSKIVLAAKEDANDPSRLIHLLENYDIKCMQATPSTWELLVNANWQGKSNLIALSGGETISLKLAEKLLESSKELWNCYGPTEASVWSLVKKIHSHELSNTFVPLGDPLTNYYHYILDEKHQLLPIGSIGELYIGGSGLARGYFNLPDLTKEKFIQNPFNDNPLDRLYKTGDLVRYMSNGSLEYIGRVDSQLKLRGYRIELGEIEYNISLSKYVSNCVVEVSYDKNNNKYLTAYIVLNKNKRIGELKFTNHIKNFLRSRLPEYMIPLFFIILDKLPLTSNGKIDKNMLPKANEEHIQKQEYTAARGALEIKICQAWELVLGLERIGVNDNFFDLGGYSLLMVKIQSILSKFNINISVRDFYQYQTISELSSYLQSDLACITKEESYRDNIIKMNSSKCEVNLFGVHPQGGHVQRYVDLANGLTDTCVFYGLEVQDLYSDYQTHSIADLVNNHIKAIKSVQPSGPYFLLGWSSGGRIAYEIACRLKELNNEVAYIAMLDSTPCISLNKQQSSARVWYDAIMGVIHDAISLDWNSLKNLSEEKGIEFLADHIIEQDLYPEDFRENINRFLTYLCNIRRAFDQYDSTKSNLDIHLYKVRRLPSEKDIHNFNEKENYGWESFTTGNIHVIPMEGEHQNMIDQPYLDSLLDKIKTEFNKFV